MRMKIGELAKMARCQVVTIRYYEKEGLLAKPERTGSNYRLYGEKDLERLRFIRHCRRHGIKLAEIRRLLTFKDNPGTSCDWINSLVEKQIADVTGQLESLTRLKEELEQLAHRCSGGNKAKCGILESLENCCPHCGDFSCPVEESAHGAPRRPEHSSSRAV